MPKGVYERTTANAPKKRVYPEHIVEAVRRMYISEGMTVREIQEALPPGYKAQRIIERHVPTRRTTAKRDQRGSRNHMWKGSSASYGAIHLRLGQARGGCVECDAEAVDWSYQGGCPGEMGGSDEPPYCPHAEHYQPRCRPCHHRYDYKGRRPNGQFVSRQEVMPYV